MTDQGWPMMSRMPSHPEAFAERVSKILARLKPHLDVQPGGPAVLLVDGRRLDLENLMRLVATDEDRGSEIVEQYLAHLFDDDAMAAGALPWEVVKKKVMPRIQPIQIFEHLSQEMVAHVPYVNGTAIVFVIDLPHMTVSITTEQMVHWGVSDAEVLDEIARNNLRTYAEELECRQLDADGGGKAIVVSAQDGYDASRLLLDDLHAQLAPELGGDFLVGTPSRDLFVAVSIGPDDFLTRFRQRVDEDYRRLPYPITNRLFYVTMDGVAGTERQAA